MEHVISYQSHVCDASRRIDNASFRSITRCEVVYKVEQPPSRILVTVTIRTKSEMMRKSFTVGFFFIRYMFLLFATLLAKWIRNGVKNYATRGRAEQTSVEWAGWRVEWAEGCRWRWGWRRMLWSGNEIKRNMLATRQHGINQFNLLSQRVKERRGEGKGRER